MMDNKKTSVLSKKKNAYSNDPIGEVLSQEKIKDIIAQKAYEILSRKSHEPVNTNNKR